MRLGRRMPIRTESIVDTITQQQSGAFDVGVAVVRPDAREDGLDPVRVVEEEFPGVSYESSS